MAWRGNHFLKRGMEITRRATRTTAWTTLRMSSDIAWLYLRAQQRPDLLGPSENDDNSDAASVPDSFFGLSDSDYSDAETMYLPPGPPRPGPPPGRPSQYLPWHRVSSIHQVSYQVDPIELPTPSRRLRTKTSWNELLIEGQRVKNKRLKVKSDQDKKARRRWRQERTLPSQTERKLQTDSANMCG